MPRNNRNWYSEEEKLVALIASGRTLRRNVAPRTTGPDMSWQWRLLGIQMVWEQLSHGADRRSARGVGYVA